MKYIIQILICIFFIGMTKNIYAQNYGFKKDQKEDYEIDLNLHSDSSYTLISCHQYPNTSFSMTSILSMGNFSVINNKYTLLDKNSNYRMILLCHKDTLYTERGFMWMKKGSFVIKDINPNNNSLDYANSMPQKSEISTLKKRLENNQKDKNPLIYETYYFNKLFQITIGEDKSYNIYRYNIVFSEGFWERKGNVLLLYDKDVNGRFSMFINADSSLTSIVIPGDYLMREFKIEQLPVVGDLR